jgi:hypothetical protein
MLVLLDVTWCYLPLLDREEARHDSDDALLSASGFEEVTTCGHDLRRQWPKNPRKNPLCCYRRSRSSSFTMFTAVENVVCFLHWPDFTSRAPSNLGSPMSRRMSFVGLKYGSIPRVSEHVVFPALQMQWWCAIHCNSLVFMVESTTPHCQTFQPDLQICPVHCRSSNSPLSTLPCAAGSYKTFVWRAETTTFMTEKALTVLAHVDNQKVFRQHM